MAPRSDGVAVPADDAAGGDRTFGSALRAMLTAPVRVGARGGDPDAGQIIRGPRRHHATARGGNADDRRHRGAGHGTGSRCRRRRGDRARRIHRGEACSSARGPAPCRRPDRAAVRPGPSATRAEVTVATPRPATGPRRRLGGAAAPGTLARRPQAGSGTRRPDGDGREQEPSTASPVPRARSPVVGRDPARAPSCARRDRRLQARDVDRGPARLRRRGCPRSGLRVAVVPHLLQPRDRDLSGAGLDAAGGGRCHPGGGAGGEPGGRRAGHDVRGSFRVEPIRANARRPARPLGHVADVRGPRLDRRRRAGLDKAPRGSAGSRTATLTRRSPVKGSGVVDLAGSHARLSARSCASSASRSARTGAQRAGHLASAPPAGGVAARVA